MDQGNRAGGGLIRTAGLLPGLGCANLSFSPATIYVEALGKRAMRFIASLIALSLIGFAAPAASACRIGPTPILVAVWDQAPTPDKLRPGEVALEVALPANADLIEPRAPDEIVVTTCNPDQVMLFQIVRVLAGDAHGAEFVVVPGSMIMTLIQVDPATGSLLGPAAPERWFLVGTLHAQSKYVVVGDNPAAGTAGRALPALDTR